MMLTFIIAFFFLTIQVQSRTKKLNTLQFIEKYGYKCETHFITTEDGYILTYQRIPHGIDQDSPNKPSVILVHGLCSSSAEYVNLGPKRALGFILANSGYDVWIANSRGTDQSINHTTLDPYENPKEFFDFSWHEIGFYDIPAVVDYILNITGEDSLHYIGYSQGGTAFFVFGSLRPEYSDKVKLATLMAPSAMLEQYLHHIRKPFFRCVQELIKSANRRHLYDLSPISNRLQNILFNGCANEDLFLKDICSNVASIVKATGITQIDGESLAILAMNLPNNFALKQGAHYIQQILNGGFRQFDYGSKQNHDIYGTTSPPEYNLSEIKIPTAIYMGQNDEIAGYSNLPKLASKLKSLVHIHIPKDRRFNHIDFVVHKDIIEQAYSEMIRFMKLYD